jgi:ComF family protein
VASALAPAVGFVLPDSCVSCGDALGRGERHLCPACWREVRPAAYAVELPGTVPEGRRHVVERRAFFLLAFDGAPRALIHALKYGRRTSVAASLVRAVLPALAQLPLSGLEIVVPVPLHAVRLRERGFNQAALLAEEVGRALGQPVRSGLRRTRATREQTGLTRARRLGNVAAAFAADPDRFRGSHVLLLDDVVTTGATLGAAAAALVRAGAESVVCVALAGRVRDA